MQVTVARRVEPRPTGELGACALLGFGAGIAAGFLLSEVFGAGGHRRVGRLLGGGVARRNRRVRAAATRAARLARVREALAADAALAAEPIEARARGHGLELSGWVTTRAARARANRLAREAAGSGAEITNHLLVRGEDDRAGAREDSPRSA